MGNTPSPAEGAKQLQAAARALVDAVFADEGGQPGRMGHGGLLSRETLLKADAVRRLLDRETQP